MKLMEGFIMFQTVFMFLGLTFLAGIALIASIDDEKTHFKTR
jgi:hypothetical protein